MLVGLTIRGVGKAGVRQFIVTLRMLSALSCMMVKTILKITMTITTPITISITIALSISITITNGCIHDLLDWEINLARSNILKSTSKPANITNRCCHTIV